MQRVLVCGGALQHWPPSVVVAFICEWKTAFQKQRTVCFSSIATKMVFSHLNKQLKQQQ